MKSRAMPGRSGVHQRFRSATLAGIGRMTQDSRTRELVDA